MTKARCKGCGAINDLDAQFCKVCGAKFIVKNSDILNENMNQDNILKKNKKSQRVKHIISSIITTMVFMIAIIFFIISPNTLKNVIAIFVTYWFVWIFAILVVIAYFLYKISNKK